MRNSPGKTATASRRSLLVLCLCATVLANSERGDDRLAEFEKGILAGGGGQVSRAVFREYTVEILVRQQPMRGLGVLGQFLANAVPRDGERQLNVSTLKELCPVADAYLLLRLCHDRAAVVPEDVARWLFDSDANLSLFLDTITLADNWRECLRHVDTLHAHDPKGRDAFRNLILALAVVWDQKQAPLHRQMGGGQLPFTPDVKAFYDYFRELYASRKAKIPYHELSVTALRFVVHVPVPLSELRWARENVRGSARSWKRKFSEIRYDKKRIASGTFQWPWGAYTLARIKEKGGICVDQAYYATITARAFGIPALMFVGQGRRGPHAWFGYLEDQGEWVLDTGRYRYDKYATGHALDPQLNRPMTDHSLEYTCDRALQSSRYAGAIRFTRLAIVLHDLDRNSAALQSAELSIKLTRVYDLPWQIQEQILSQQNRPRDLLALLNQKANAFRRYPDFLASIRKKQADVLKDLGRPQAAQRLLERNERRLGDGRDDILRFLVSEQIKAAYERGDFTEARELLEDLLRKQKYEGQKVLSLVEAYLALTQQTGQTKEGARFLRRYLEYMRRRYDNHPQNEAVFLRLLLRAYENDGDERHAEKVRRKLERLR